MQSKKPVKPTTSKDYKPAIRGCKCSSPYQDDRYGKGQRLFNKGKEEYSCTVCGRNEK